MTTPAGVTTGSFQGTPFPADVVAQVINLLIAGAPLAGSFTRQQTSRSAVAWPTARPSGWAWLRELEAFPAVALDDDAYVVAVAKIGGILDLSNESVGDDAINLTDALGTMLADSLSRDLDLGLLHGDGPPEPVGVLGVAAEAAGDDLLGAVAAARGQIADQGGVPDTLAVSGTMLAEADTARDATGQLLYPAGFAAAASLAPVVVPGLAVPLVYDSTRVFLVVRDDAAVDLSRDWHFNLDATSIRVKARVAAAIPDPDKAIRKLAISGDGGSTGNGGSGDVGGGAASAPVRAPAPRSGGRRQSGAGSQ